MDDELLARLYGEGKSYEDIAAATGIARSVVYRHLKRLDIMENRMSDANWFPNGYEVKPEERDRWLDVRRNGVGASEAAVLLGYPMYGKTAVAIWAEKSGLQPAWL